MNCSVISLYVPHMDNTKTPFKAPRKINQECSQEKDQESAVLQALGRLEKGQERIIDLLQDLQDYEREDGEESQDDEESSSM